MIDRDKVVKGLEHCRFTDKDCETCPYYKKLGCLEELVSDALALLTRPDCEHAEHDGIGCLGYSGCKQDDEPIEPCKRCEKYTGNVTKEWWGRWM